MSIEQQISDALSDFEALITEGWEVSDALAEAATSNSLTPENFKRRLERAGSIEEVVSEVRRRADRRKVEVQIEVLVEQFLVSGVKWFERGHEARERMLDWINKSIGRPLTSVEIAFSDRAYRRQRELSSERWHREQMRSVRQYLNSHVEGEDAADY